MRYAGARQQGLTEEKIAALDGGTLEAFTPREQAALRFAELMAVDHHKVDDALFAELKRHFTEAEIVELGVSVALYLGLGRFTAVLGVDPGPACH
ncbi:MAG: carboxymuconolactone decarboxylase family protein [Nitrospinae bacterium]|nr:carboxymuconolactone decarboxylase family protein [Nitrospinota bacterium]